MNEIEIKRQTIQKEMDGIFDSYLLRNPKMAIPQLIKLIVDLKTDLHFIRKNKSEVN